MKRGSTSLAIMETQIKTTGRNHFTSARLKTEAGAHTEKMEPSYPAGWWDSTWEIVWQFLTRLSTVVTYDPAIPLLGTMKTYCHTKTHTGMSLQHYSWSLKNGTTHMSSTDEWINKIWHSHVVEYYLDTQRNKVLTQSAAQTHLENTHRKEPPQKAPGVWLHFHELPEPAGWWLYVWGCGRGNGGSYRWEQGFFWGWWTQLR